LNAVQAHQQTETDLHRVILFASQGEELLVLPEPGRLRLPEVSIPPQQRIAEHLTEALCRDWSQDAVSLFGLDTSSTDSATRYQVMESIDGQRSDGAGLRRVSLPSLRDCQFERSADAMAVARAIAECKEYAAGSKHDPFGRLGWFAELTEWVRDQIRSAGLVLNDRFRQINASPTFSLVRFETDGPAVWFKAVGKPNLHEFPISLTLAKFFPGYVPSIFGTQPACHGWLMADVSGSPLSEAKESSPWQNAMTGLAGLQIESLDRTEVLLQAGCKDFRIPAVLRKIDPFLETMADLMQRQPLTPPSALSSSELKDLGRSLKNACQRLQELRIPDSLGHGDLNLANIIVGEHRSVFIDWAEAYVGHPFSTFEYLQLACVNCFQEFEDDRSLLEGSYTQAWETVCSSGCIAEALSLTPILAVLLKGLNTAEYLDANIHRNSRVARRLRSLTRRMQLETQKTTKLGATWAVS
jgi:Phosphotransferase enzyme family